MREAHEVEALDCITEAEWAAFCRSVGLPVCDEDEAADMLDDQDAWDAFDEWAEDNVGDE